MKPAAILANDHGAVMNIALLLLLLLSLIVISLGRLSGTNLKIATFDKQSKVTFHHADSGIEMGWRLIEENITCRGFKAGMKVIGGVTITDENIRTKAPLAPGDKPSEANRDLAIPREDGTTTSVILGGDGAANPGSGAAMVSAYDGLGRSSGVGGSFVDYDIWANHQGKANSQSTVGVGWKHINGMEEDFTACKYNN